MTAAVVLVFLLNGMQVDLPAPALMFGDNAYVPARAVFEKLGWEVSWDADQKKIRVAVKDLCAYSFTVDDPKLTLEYSTCPTTPAGSQKTLAAPPLLVGDFVYVPVSAVTLITGSRAEWDGPTVTVNLITTATGEPQPAGIGEIIANPPAWVGKLVRLRGEYTGWQADPFGPAVIHGPPVTRSDWTLRDAGGSLYCTRAAGVQEFTVKLAPLADLGRRLEVVGTVALAGEGWPYLQATEVSLLDGLEGITCYLTTDRHTYQPGDTLHMQMQVRNPTVETVVLHFPTSQSYDFTVRNPEGGLVWQWSRGRMFAQMLTQKALKSGDAYTVSAEWPIPADLAPGLYQVSGALNREVQSYVKTVSVAKEE